MSEAIGALRARVHLQSLMRDDDDLGGTALTWNEQGAVWADIAALSTSRGADFDTAPSTTSYRIAIRPRADVRPGWRVVWGARVFLVVAVRDDDGARIELDCEEERL